MSDFASIFFAVTAFAIYSLASMSIARTVGAVVSFTRFFMMFIEPLSASIVVSLIIFAILLFVAPANYRLHFTTFSSVFMPHIVFLAMTAYTSCVVFFVPFFSMVFTDIPYTSARKQHLGNTCDMHLNLEC
ncbi:hypothetical protein K7432_008861 [Basidiobolus ranarum]|uniref:Uncharacterized protein n=1 Tax=Basidiobolus ranarum TaxID=34480 RepID=A0ABR2WR76_9FUNG